MDKKSYLDSEFYLFDITRAKFSCSGREYLGTPALNSELLQQLSLLELEHSPRGYGRALFDAMLPRESELREGFREAIRVAERAQQRLRFRLHLGSHLPDKIHALLWELLLDTDRGLPLARSPDSVFSRYSTVNRKLGRPARVQRCKLLCVVSAPSDAAAYGMAEIDRDAIFDDFHKACKPFSERVSIEVLEPPATPGRLRQRLVEGDFHALHLVGHGQVQRRGAANLALEERDGTACFVHEDLLAEIFLGDRGLRLVTLMACHGGAASAQDSFSGLAGRLVERGVPAVVAMRHRVELETAHHFTTHFYRHLVRTGRVDAAINEARQQLFLAASEKFAWSNPLLYMRLEDGLVWQAIESSSTARTVLPPHPPAPPRQPSPLRSPRNWVPALLFLFLVVLGNWSTTEAKAELTLKVSRLHFRLAKGGTVVDLLPLNELLVPQLAALELRNSFHKVAQGRELLGVYVTRAEGSPEDSSLTLDLQNLAAGTEVSLERQEDHEYLLSLWEVQSTPGDPTRASRLAPVRVNLKGHVSLKLLDSTPRRELHLTQVEPLFLSPRRGRLDLNLQLREPESLPLAADLRIDRLFLLRVEETHTPELSKVETYTSILGGSVELLGSKEVHPLANGEILRFEKIHGVLARLVLNTDGIDLLFRGEVTGLERTTGENTESLMPSHLDLWVSGPLQTLLLILSGALAALLPIFAASRPFSGVSPPLAHTITSPHTLH